MERLFGRTFFLDRPTPRRLHAWRRKAQEAAAAQAGYAFQAYAQGKFTSIVQRLASLVVQATDALAEADTLLVERALFEELVRRGLAQLADEGGAISPAAVDFFRVHDIGFRIRRMRLLATRLARDWEPEADHPGDALDRAHRTLYAILALYYERERLQSLGGDFTGLAEHVLAKPGELLDHMAAHRLLPDTDVRCDEMLADLLETLPRDLRRRMLLTYLGFPFYDAATFNLLRDDNYAEFDPVKVDRISPDDALSIRQGGTRATLRGIEFYNFGAFFSRAYRENDYLWGRLHGAERMVDLVVSTVDGGMEPATILRFKRDAFLAILDQEEGRLRADPALVPGLRDEVLAIVLTASAALSS